MVLVHDGGMMVNSGCGFRFVANGGCWGPIRLVGDSCQATGNLTNEAIPPNGDQLEPTKVCATISSGSMREQVPSVELLDRFVF